VNPLFLAIVGSLALAGFHVLSVLFRDLPARHRAILTSVSGGAGLAYVFLYLLFELVSEGAAKLHALVPLGPEPLATLFLLLLSALSVTHILQMQLEKTPSLQDDHRGFALLFLAYNLLAGAGVVEEATWGIQNLVFYVTAIGFHLLFNDLFLLHRFPAHHSWRWRSALGAAPVLGCGLAAGFGLPAGALYASLALLAGGTITNAFRSELPEQRSFRPIAFAAGVVGYGAVIFATWRF
jgi:hypothetical protein